ncbi:YHS domain-containing protein [bacterium CPR1]|nr:YHS domain-containing protein [bacterium CPR1]
MFGGFFRHLLQGFAPSEAGARPSAPDAMSRLTQSYEEIQSFVRQATQKVETASGWVTAEEAERQRSQRNEAVRLFREDILDCHGRLCTGLSSEQLDRLGAMLVAHLQAQSSGTLEEQIDAAVGQRLYSECGSLAWGRLEGLRILSGETWPVPESLASSRTVRELEPVLEQHQREVRQLFLHRDPADSARLLVGEVDVWCHVYPERGSWLWRQTALQAVGAALRAQLFVAALEAWLWRPEELDQAVQKLVLEHVQACQESAERSLQGALELSRRIQVLCQQVLPDLVWATVAPRLQWEVTSSPTVQSLAQGLEFADPVCGMSLTAARVADRYAYRGQTNYFCSTQCRRKFEQQPERFLR